MYHNALATKTHNDGSVPDSEVSQPRYMAQSSVLRAVGLPSGVGSGSRTRDGLNGCRRWVDEQPHTTGRPPERLMRISETSAARRRRRRLPTAVGTRHAHHRRHSEPSERIAGVRATRRFEFAVDGALISGRAERCRMMVERPT